MSYLNQGSRGSHPSLKLIPCLLSRFNLVAEPLRRKIVNKKLEEKQLLIMLSLESHTTIQLPSHTQLPCEDGAFVQNFTNILKLFS